MILITGATGTVGSETIRQLAATGQAVRGLARSPEKAKGMLVPGIEIVAGDLSDPASLEAALRGMERALLLPPVDEQAVALQENFIAAARRAGTKRIVKLSALGAALDSRVPFLRQHAEGQRILEASGIPFTELQPNGFMQNLFVAAPTIAGEGVIYQPAADATISHVDVRDIAAVAVKALTEAGHEGKRYPITGPEALSFEEVAAKLSAALGKPVRYVDVAPADYKRGLMQYGVSEWQADAILALYAFYREGKGALVTNTVAEVTGKAPIPLEQFLRDYADAFRGNRG